MDDNNVVRFGVRQPETPSAPAKDTLPVFDYAFMLMDGTTIEASGFLIFTSAHIAVMEDTPDGAVPQLVVPLANVQFVERAADEGTRD